MTPLSKFAPLHPRELAEFAEERFEFGEGRGGGPSHGKIERKQAAEDYKQLRILARVSELWDGSGASDVMCLNKNSSQESGGGPNADAAPLSFSGFLFTPATGL